jgi:hypothetical protein
MDADVAWPVVVLGTGVGGGRAAEKVAPSKSLRAASAVRRMAESYTPKARSDCGRHQGVPAGIARRGAEPTVGPAPRPRAQAPPGAAASAASTAGAT